MVIFETGIKLLIGTIFIFFLILSYLCYSWSAMHEKRQRILIAIGVPLIYSFQIFIIGTIILAAISLFLEYLKIPQLPPL